MIAFLSMSQCIRLSAQSACLSAVLSAVLSSVLSAHV